MFQSRRILVSLAVVYIIFDANAFLVASFPRMSLSSLKPFLKTTKLTRFVSTDESTIVSEVRDPTNVDPNVLEFVDPTTNIAIKLVGSMHYNPHSIKVAQATCEDLAKESLLGSVLVESCPSRWQKTASFQPSGSMLRAVLDNEMQAAADVAVRYGVPVVLGDQDISSTNARMGFMLKQSVVDLLTPWNAGWSRLFDDVKEGLAKAMPSGPEYLGLESFLHPRLLAAAPVSLVRYPLAILAKSPLVGGPLLALFLTSSLHLLDPAVAGIIDPTTAASSSSLTDGGLAATGAASSSSMDVAMGVLLSSLAFVVETALLSRVFLVALLAERNEVIAENILAECRRIADEDEQLEKQQRSKPQMWSSIRGKGASSSSGRGPERRRTVVAVLGMAHCNGVQKIILGK